VCVCVYVLDDLVLRCVCTYVLPDDGDAAASVHGLHVLDILLHMCIFISHSLGKWVHVCIYVCIYIHTHIYMHALLF
jgi:hypothetical protein